MAPLLVLAFVHAAHGAPLELGPPAIDVEITRFEARYTVRYEVRNPGPLPDEATVELFMPDASAVTGLRYQPRAGAAWLDARLLPKEDAIARWETYVEAPFGARRGPALVELQGGVPVLRLLFVPASDRVAVEYTAVAPVCRAAGHWIAPSPRLDVAVEARHAVRGPRGAGRRVSGEDLVALAGAPMRDACASSEPSHAWDGDHFVAVAATEIPETRGVDGRLVLVPAGHRRIVEVTIDTGARLSPAPRDASVVFVIDASISMGAEGVHEQLAIVRAYLARSPGARFELVVYRRHAAPVFGRWRGGTDVARALAEVGDAPFALANGSSLDAGLTRAAALLARAPGPRRLVAFTDDLVREALDEDLARASLAGLPADAVVHVVATRGETGDHSQLRRDFEHWLAPVAARWGGVVAWATLGGAAENARARADVFEELVRPRRIDRVVVAEGGGDSADLGAIQEGDSVRQLRIVENDAVTVSGFIWGTPWEPMLVTSERDQRRVAALAVAAGLDVQLEPAVQRAVATLGHVVGEATSLWADDPRWSPGGLPPEVSLAGRGNPGVIGGTTGGGSFTTRIRHGGHGVFGRVRPKPDLTALLAGPVAACAARHGRSMWNVGLAVETTGREIVDVRLVGGDDDAAFDRCVIESTWSLALGADFDPWTATFEVNVLGDRARH